MANNIKTPIICLSKTDSKVILRSSLPFMNCTSNDTLFINQRKKHFCVKISNVTNDVTQSYPNSRLGF